MVDIAIVLILVLCATWGVLRGGLFHLIGIAALVAAWLLSPLLGPLVSGFILSKTQWTPGAAQIVGRLLAFFLLYVGLMAIGTVIDYRFRKIKNLSLQGMNRALGGVFGFIWGAVLCFVLLCLGDVWLKVFPDTQGFLADSVRSSRLRQRISEINPADRFLVTDTLRLFRAARQEPELLDRLREKPYIREILNDPDFVKLSKDPDFQEAVQQQDYARALKNKNLQAVLENKELREKLLSPETRATIQEVLEGWQPPPPKDQPDQGDAGE